MKSTVHIIGAILLSIIPLSVTSSPAAALSDDEIAAIEKKTWTITIDTDVNDLYPDGIQYSIIDRDPMPTFKTNRSANPQKTADKDELLVNISVSWDMIFRDIPGSEVALLASRSRNEFSMCSDSPSGRKWLVTKVATRKNGEQICWHIPIDVEIGKKYTIRLDETNCTYLRDME